MTNNQRMKCDFCTNYALRESECLLGSANALLNAHKQGVESNESLAAEGFDFQDFANKPEAARILINVHPRPEDFVQFIDETAEVATETCSTQTEIEKYIKQSWDFDDARRRNAFGGKFATFRQHVLNVLDANYPNLSFSN